MQKRPITYYLTLLSLSVASCGAAETAIEIIKTTLPGLTKPIPVALSGFSGEVASVIQFDLYVQGFKFVKPEEAQYLISGSNAGSVKGRVTDRITKDTLLSRGYSGAVLRRQAHTFTDDVVASITRGKGIATTRITCKVDKGRNADICVADFDGHGAKSVTSSDNALAKSPAWLPGQPVLFYTSYKRGRPEILSHNITTGKRELVAGYSGSNFMPSPSPNGSKVAMILSKSGTVDLYVANIDGTGLKRLTKNKEPESSPCWSPDGRWICFATKVGARRVLARVSPNGGTVERIRVAGVSNPSEPDWSPDGEWIAFTAQMGNFELCVVPAEGGDATILVSGEDPSWAPNSRTLVFTRRTGGRNTLSLLDVPTKQFKDVPRISGSNNSQPAWAR